MLLKSADRQKTSQSMFYKLPMFTEYILSNREVRLWGK